MGTAKMIWLVVAGVIAALAVYVAVVLVAERQAATTIAQVSPTPLPTRTTVPTRTPTTISMAAAQEVGKVEPNIVAKPTLGSLKTTESGSVMIYVPAGEFLMGSTETDSDALSDEKPQHPVFLDAFWIDKFEVTNAQYRECVDHGPCSTPPDWKDAVDDHPVANVSWRDVEMFLRWLNEKTGKSYRLPTEAEWEKAACWDPVKQTKRIYPWGDEFDKNLLKPKVGVLPHCQSIPTAPVGSYADNASPYGAMDMVASVWEWTADWYGMQYYSNSLKVDPPGPQSGFARTLRGGWIVTKNYARCSTRSLDYPPSRHFVGFRLAESVTP